MPKKNTTSIKENPVLTSLNEEKAMTENAAIEKTATQLAEKVNSIDSLKAEVDRNLQKIASLCEEFPARKDQILLLAQLAKPEVLGVENSNNRWNLARLALKQPTSNGSSVPEDAKNGQLYSTDGDIFSSLELIPVLQHPMRIKWAQGEEKSNLDCTSIDGVKGSKYGKCSDCPYGRYEKDKKTECNSGSSFYFASADLSALYRTDFMKTSAAAGREILKTARPPALWARTYTLASEKKTGVGNTYYVLTAKPTGKKTDPETMKICSVLYDFFSSMRDVMLAERDQRLADNAHSNGDVIDIMVPEESMQDLTGTI